MNSKRLHGLLLSTGNKSHGECEHQSQITNTFLTQTQTTKLQHLKTDWNAMHAKKERNVKTNRVGYLMMSRTLSI